MGLAKIFTNGRSQAVRLPKECRFSCPEVHAVKVGECVVLIPADDPLAGFKIAPSLFTDDFMADHALGAAEAEVER